MARKYSDEMILKAFKCAINNRVQLEKDKKCGCFSCLSIYETSKIQSWTDEEYTTAICPYCYEDTVIGEGYGFPITREFLEEMQAFWIPERYKYRESWYYW